MSQRIGHFCGACSLYNEFELSASAEEGTRVCTACGHRDAFDVSDSLARGGPVDRCPLCANLQLYTRKDFPQQLGCAAVTGTVLLSSIAYAFWDFPAALSVLVLASIADFALYHRLGEVTVCYRCHTELRGFEPNPEHGVFDMHRAEEYEQGH